MTQKDAFTSNDYSDNGSASESNDGRRTKQQDAIAQSRPFTLLATGSRAFLYLMILLFFFFFLASENESRADDQSDSDQEEDEDRVGSTEGKLRCQASGIILLATHGVSHLLWTSTMQSLGSSYSGGGHCLTPTSQKKDVDHEKCEQGEALFLSNLRRRSIRFVEQPDEHEFEAAPLYLHDKLYYSHHDFHIMKNEANAEKLQ